MKNPTSKIFADFLDSFWKHYAVWTFLLTLYFTGLYAWLFYASRGDFFYVDTDCYTRALRIVDWLQNFEWQEKIFPYTAHPQGFVLHFTRISDIIWLLFSLPFMPFMPLKEAVFYGGFFFSPFFLFLTVWAVLWGVKPYLEQSKDKQALFASVFLFSFIFCCKLTHAFDFYRPDHHAMMCFVFSFAISAVLRSYVKTNKTELSLAGIFTGIGLWASSAPEGLYIAAVILLILSVDMIFFGLSNKIPLYYSAGLFYATATAWIINPPYGGWSVIDNARLSVLHVALCGLIYASFAIFRFFNINGKIKQISALGGMAIISAILLYFVFGSEALFAPIYAEPVLKYFLPRINEMRSIIELNKFLLPPVLVGAVIIYFLSAKTSHTRCLWLLYFLTAPIGVMVARFYAYYLSVWLVLFAFGLFALAKQKNNGDKYKTILFIYVVAPIFYLTSFNFEPQKILMPEVSGVVLTDTFRGPELVWRQGVDTVSSPYHTNVKGINDEHEMWFTTNEKRLKKLLKRHHVNYVVLPDTIKSKYYIEPEDNTDKLYGKVLTGKNLYPWMERTAINTYRINYDKF